MKKWWIVLTAVLVIVAAAVVGYMLSTAPRGVASADNVTVRSAYFEAAGRKITFTDTATTNNPEGGFIRVLGGKTLGSFN